MPFALAVGSYLLILLSIYATSCSLYLPIQSSMATASWINLQGAETPHHNPCNATMLLMYAAMARFIWDPGGISMLPIDPVTGVDHPPVPLHGSMHPSPTMSPLVDRLCVLLGDDFALLCDDVVVVAAQQLNLLAVPKSPTISFFHYSHPVLSTMVLTASSRRHPVLLHPTWLRDADPASIASILPTTSLFHYCHPVLSRPTVPNIDS